MICIKLCTVRFSPKRRFKVKPQAKMLKTKSLVLTLLHVYMTFFHYNLVHVPSLTDASPIPKPLTAELAFTHLLHLSSKWQSLGEALSLHEDQLDEIYTNNETDEACLQNMLELYVARPGFSHSWEKIEAAKEAVEQLNHNAGLEKGQLPPEPETHDNLTPSELLCMYVIGWGSLQTSRFHCMHIHVRCTHAHALYMYIRDCIWENSP